MRPLVLTLRTDPDERLDLSALVPHRLSDKTAAEIGKLELQTGRQRITVGDIFRVRAGDPQRVRIEGGTDRFDQVGQDMAGGEIVVEGDVGNQAGRLMTNGRLIINGNAGRWAASGMQGGQVEIAGSAGDRVGGPLAGEMGGDARWRRGGQRRCRRTRWRSFAPWHHRGGRSGWRLRRCGMIAGTLIVRRAAGPLPGYLMRRGTVVLAGGCDELSPTFLDCGVHDLVAMRLMAAFVADYSAAAGAALRAPLRRLAGDMAVLGKGEVFCVGA
jgi:Formylmethanofuran dehydrogenase subunit C